MISILDLQFIERKEGKAFYRLELHADTEAELAEVTEINGMTLAHGSRAICSDGHICTFNGSGKWQDFTTGTEIGG